MATGGRDDSRTMHGVPNTGTVVPNAVFVGGISSKTNEEDLRNLFSMYGNVKSTKVILDRSGSSKGYGFVTFETEEEAQKVLNEAKCVTLKERKLNLATAVKKHLYNRGVESGSMHTAPVLWSYYPYMGSPGFPSSREQLSYPQATWPLVWQQQLHLPQQLSYQHIMQPGYSPYLYPIAPSEYPYQAVGQIAGSDNSDTSASDSENGRNRSTVSTQASIPDHEKHRTSQTKSYSQNLWVPKYNGGSVDNPNYAHSSPVPQLHHILAKTVNGVVMAYPTPIVMGSPTLLHMADNGDSENMSELGYMHSPIASGALTPPSTPMIPLSCDFNINASMESLRKN